MGISEGAARYGRKILEVVGLKGSQLMGETLGGPYIIMLATLWAVEVADVFIYSICIIGTCGACV